MAGILNLNLRKKEKLCEKLTKFNLTSCTIQPDFDSGWWGQHQKYGQNKSTIATKQLKLKKCVE